MSSFQSTMNRKSKKWELESCIVTQTLFDFFSDSSRILTCAKNHWWYTQYQDQCGNFFDTEVYYVVLCIQYFTIIQEKYNSRPKAEVTHTISQAFSFFSSQTVVQRGSNAARFERFGKMFKNCFKKSHFLLFYSMRLFESIFIHCAFCLVTAKTQRLKNFFVCLPFCL